MKRFNKQEENRKRNMLAEEGVYKMQKHKEGITIRHVRESDAEAIRDMFAQDACYPSTTHLPYPTIAFWQQRFSKIPSGEYHFVAERDGEFIGSVMIMTPSSPRRRHTALFGITIREEFQGQGIGSLLMDVVIDFCHNWLAVTRIELGVYIDNDNDAAVALYKKFGFVIESTSMKDIFRNGKYIDGYKMVKLLTPSPLSKQTDSLSRNTLRKSPASVFSTEQINIRHSEPSDAKQVQALYEQPSCYANTLQLPYPSEANWHNKLTNMSHSLVVEYQGEIIAQAGLFTFSRSRVQHQAGLGMAVSEQYQGQGIGSILLTEILNLAFNWMALKRITLEVYIDNHAGIALYKKHGFSTEGTARQFAFRDGQYVDVHYMALCK